MKSEPFFSSKARICIHGASPEECLNRFAAEGLPFWDIRSLPKGGLCVSILYGDLSRAERLSLAAYCDLELLSHWGLPQRIQQILRRPVLLFGIILAFFFSFFLQRYIWSVNVAGEDPEINRQIARVLQEAGICFGSPARSIDSQEVKLEMIRKIPELSWLTVNRRGGRLTVLYLLRDRENETEAVLPNHLVAARDAVITELIVLEGMRMVTLGDTVRKGQLLVSGLEDYGLVLKGVRAEGEIYGDTWRSGSVISPAVRSEKRYTGREWTEYILIFGRKRINLFGNSGIYPATCDKIISEKILTLPNVDFALRLQMITLREYTLQEIPLSPDAAHTSMERSWHEGLRMQMVAGTVNRSDGVFLRMEGYYILHIRSHCREMIAVPVPVEEVYKGEGYD